MQAQYEELKSSLELTKTAFNDALTHNFNEPQSRTLKVAARRFKTFMPKFQVIGNTASIISEREALLRKSVKMSRIA